MRTIRPVLLAAGAVILAVLVVRVGWEPIVTTLGRLAWWQFALICLPYAAIMAVDTLGWRYAFARDRVPYHRLLGARIAGEALNVVTAVASLGGEAVKAWLVRRDVPYEESVPSVVIAKTTIVIGQALFLLAGIVIAWTALDLDSGILTGMLWLLVIEVAAVGGFLAAQLAGVVARAGRLLAWFGVIDDPAYAQRLDRSLRRYYRERWRRLSLSIGFHVLGWLLGAAETLLILSMLGIGVSAATATLVEALGTGVRFATFLVPASLGALEGANAAAFGALGLGASAGLAYSFVRRARQAVWIAIGIVTLLVMRMRGSEVHGPHPPERRRRPDVPGARGPAIPPAAP